MKKILKEILDKNNLSGEQTKEFAGGQINHTYQIGEDFVVKIQKDLDVLLHQVPLMEMCHKVEAKVPKITDAGLIDGKEYIVMKKLPGRKLSEDWHTFSTKLKESFIAQIAEQLKMLHSISFEKYSPQRPLEFYSWKDAAQYHIDFSFLETTDFDGESRENIILLRDYLEDNIQILQKSEPPVLVHNDLHFENILYEGNKITALFDFDFARQAPKEYELWHLIDFFHTPVYFVEKELESIWKQYEVTNELSLFKKHYPELFMVDNLLDRIRLYLIVDIIDHAQSGNTGRSNHQVNSYFKTNWLEEKLGM